VHLITETEASKRLNLPPSVLRALRRKGQAPRHLVLLRVVRYDTEDLDAWVLSQMSAPSTINTTTAEVSTSTTTTTPTVANSKEVPND